MESRQLFEAMLLYTQHPSHINEAQLKENLEWIKVKGNTQYYRLPASLSIPPHVAKTFVFSVSVKTYLRADII